MQHGHALVTVDEDIPLCARRTRVCPSLFSLSIWLNYSSSLCTPGTHDACFPVHPLVWPRAHAQQTDIAPQMATAAAGRNLPLVTCPLPDCLQPCRPPPGTQAARHGARWRASQLPSTCGTTWSAGGAQAVCTGSAECKGPIPCCPDKRAAQAAQSCTRSRPAP